MVCLGLEPGAAGWKAQTNPMSYSGTPRFTFMFNQSLCTNVPISELGRHNKINRTTCHLGQQTLLS